MLTVIVVKSSSEGDVQRLTDSFTKQMDENDVSIEIDLHKVQRIPEINKIEKKGEWMIVLFDNEFIDQRLKRSLATFMAHKTYDLYVIMKRTQGPKGRVVTEAPRLFKKDVYFSRDSLIPDDCENLTTERILNGWILDGLSL